MGVRTGVVPVLPSFLPDLTSHAFEPFSSVVTTGTFSLTFLLGLLELPLLRLTSQSYTNQENYDGEEWPAYGSLPNCTGDPNELPRRAPFPPLIPYAREKPGERPRRFQMLEVHGPPRFVNLPHII